MRKPVTSSLVSGLLIIAIVVALSVVGFGTAGQAAQAQPVNPSAESILAQAAVASDSMTNGAGDFDVSVMVHADPAAMPAGTEALVNQPIELSGTYAFNGDPVAFQSQMNLSIAGQTIPMGIQVVDSQAWVQFMGQWYETPQQMMGTGSADINALVQALLSSGIDPTKWFTGLTVVGQENLNGTLAYHITAMIDANVTMTDIFGLMQNPDIQHMGQSFGMMPNQEELQSAKDSAMGWLREMTVDIWVAADTYQFRQFQVNANIVPPEGQGDGVNAITAEATVTLSQSALPVTITPPTDARPFSELEQIINTLTNLFSGI